MKAASPISIILFAASLALMATGCSSNTSSNGYSETISLSEFQENSTVYDTPADTVSAQKDSDESISRESLAVTSDSASQISPDSPTDTLNANKSSDKKPEPVRDIRIKGKFAGRLKDVFNDSNEYQLRHARRLGISPVTGLGSLYNTRRPLVMVATNEDFMIDELTHSFPFLVPEAARLLHDIGRSFRDSVAARKGGDYRIIVTSVLRTPTTVKKLRRVNRNATDQSTHQYATTFDITYNRFDCVSGQDKTNFGDLKTILAEVIRDLHAEGRCMVKYEVKSPCFHITVVK